MKLVENDSAGHGNLVEVNNPWKDGLKWREALGRSLFPWSFIGGLDSIQDHSRVGRCR